jgi:hypothetical protein
VNLVLLGGHDIIRDDLETNRPRRRQNQDSERLFRHLRADYASMNVDGLLRAVRASNTADMLVDRASRSTVDVGRSHAAALGSQAPAEQVRVGPRPGRSGWPAFIRRGLAGPRDERVATWKMLRRKLDASRRVGCQEAKLLLVRG